MTTIVFDIETDAGDFRDLEGFTKIHCMSLSKLDGTKVERKVGTPDSLGLFQDIILQSVRGRQPLTLVGHNIVSFDIPVIHKLTDPGEAKAILREHIMLPTQGSPVVIHDTRLLCQLAFPDIWASTQKNPRWKALPPKLHSSHSLKAWGMRLGILKGSFGESTDWSEYTEEMGYYCDQDVVVTKAIYEYLKQKAPWMFTPEGLKVIEREVRFAQLIQVQQRRGVYFDAEKAQRISQEISLRVQAITEELSKVFPPEIETMKTPLYWEAHQDGKVLFKAETKAGLEAIRKKRGLKPKDVTYEKGPMKTREIPFNPGSRQQIVAVLKERYGWEPTEYTEPTDLYPEGQPKVDGDVLGSLEYPEAKLLAEYLELTKVSGYIAGTDNSWASCVKNNRLHGSVDTLGANTSRCTHSKPNLAQVPSDRKMFGGECRSLFQASPGMRFVGCDASGLELRAFAGYLAYFDGGRYAKIVLEDDVHTANQKAAGLPTRDNAKTFIYGFLYGAGAAKIGQIIGKGPQAGNKLKQKFLRLTPGLEKLQDLIAKNYKNRGYLKGLDGRWMYPRSEHSALNLILQGCGAIVMKEALIQLYFALTARGYELDKDWCPVINCHDEFQLEVRPEVVPAFMEEGPKAITKAGEVLNLRCRLDGEAKEGLSWADTH